MNTLFKNPYLNAVYAELYIIIVDVVVRYVGKPNTSDNFFVPICTAATTNCTGPFPNQGLTTSLNGFGNVTRYNPKVRQFPSYNENVSLTRSFPIRESVRLEFRAESFNLLNRVRFGIGNPNGNGTSNNTVLQNANFGKITNSGDLLNNPRQLQLALKLYF